MHLRNPQDTFLYWSEKSCVWSTPTWCRSIFQVCYQNPKFLVGTKHIWVWSKSANNEGAEAWSFSSRYHRVKQPFSGTDSAGEGPMFAWDRPSNKCSPLWHFAHHSQRRNIVQIHCFDPTCPQHGLDLDPLGSNLALSGWTWHNLAPSWTRLGATSAQVEPRPLSPGDIAARRWTAFSLVFSTFLASTHRRSWVQQCFLCHLYIGPQLGAKLPPNGSKLRDVLWVDAGPTSAQLDPWLWRGVHAVLHIGLVLPC